MNEEYEQQTKLLLMYTFSPLDVKLTYCLKSEFCLKDHTRKHEVFWSKIPITACFLV